MLFLKLWLSNFFHIEIMMSAKSAVASTSKRSVRAKKSVQVSSEPVSSEPVSSESSIFDSDEFKALEEESQENIKAANVEMFEDEQVRMICAYLDKESENGELTYNKSEAWDVLSYLIEESGLPAVPVEKFIKIYSEGPDLKTVKNKFWNEVHPRLSSDQYVEKLLNKVLEICESSEFHAKKDKHYLKALQVPLQLVQDYFVCLFKLHTNEKDGWTSFTPVYWFMRDKTSYIRFSVFANNFSICTKNEWAKINDDHKFVVNDKTYYFGILQFYKPQEKTDKPKPVNKIGISVRAIMNPKAKTHFINAAKKIKDEKTFQEFLGVSFDEEKRKKTMDDFNDLISAEMLAKFQKYDKV